MAISSERTSDIDLVIDVGDLPHKRTGQELLTSITELKIKMDSVVSNMCSKLGKTHINSVTPSDLKNCSKISKQSLGEDLQSLLKLVSNVCSAEHVNFVLVSSETVLIESEQLNTFCQSITQRHKTSDDNQEKHFSDIKSELQTLSTSIESIKNSQPVVSHPVVSHPVASHLPVQPLPNTVVQNPTNHVEAHEDEFVGPVLHDKVVSFLDNCNSFELNVESGHSVAQFGEVYNYPGAKHNATKSEIPEPLKELIDLIKTEHPQSDVNSVLINKYTGPGCYLPRHSDNEPSIEPDSLIFCVSLGKSSTIKFSDMHSSTEKVLDVADNSMYCMTQKSQWFWQHRIDADSTAGFSESDVRYSLTFRSVSPRFRNSSIIVGDSNTRHLRFGQGKGTFGYNMPGKHVTAYTTEQILYI